MSLGLQLSLGPLVGLHLSRGGVGFEFRIELLPLTPVSVRLNLSWRAVIPLVAALTVLGLGITFRTKLGELSGLPDWARANWRLASGISVVIGCGIAFGLATWKRRSLLSYAVGEILAGAFSIYHTTAAFWPAHEVAKVVGIASSLYLVSRGVGNLLDAAKQAAEMRVAADAARQAGGAPPAKPASAELQSAGAT
jgi:hypothetical protein